jgi:hypothetical protein
MGDRVRWLLLTPEGRRALLAIYCAAGVVSFVTYWIMRGPGYAIGQAIVIAIGPIWLTYCLRRPWPDAAD